VRSRARAVTGARNAVSLPPRASEYRCRKGRGQITKPTSPSQAHYYTIHSHLPIRQILSLTTANQHSKPFSCLLSCRLIYQYPCIFSLLGTFGSSLSDNGLHSYLRRLESRGTTQDPPGSLTRPSHQHRSHHHQHHHSHLATPEASSISRPRNRHDGAAPVNGGPRRDSSHDESTGSSVGSPFRQNPLADNDYTFAEMNGRFCE
jgi:hypothetical protein